ncbi:cytochrome c oxidase family protein-like protein [Zopfia rhizophila CBS 207.26]|uniref:Cytochrome c oxidase subunit 9, mitochondrial n=1 Tax=Zopfia rhizophila CBS 207.26 TaxID=1314779 RepID=A0A6A6DBJ1_9PEZI|nr:cytochrome c oxidase family protein-like protein [Zopfia rhizophila CBS 207.26]
MVKPITGMLRRAVVLDITVALGLGVTAGYAFWYGYHVPAVRHRDTFYQKIEDERARNLGQSSR